MLPSKYLPCTDSPWLFGDVYMQVNAAEENDHKGSKQVVEIMQSRMLDQRRRMKSGRLEKSSQILSSNTISHRTLNTGRKETVEDIRYAGSQITPIRFRNVLGCKTGLG